MWIQVITLAVISSKPLRASEIDWCELSCLTQNGTKELNTMCKYQQQSNINGCEGLINVQNKKTKKEMLHLHNEFRDRLARGDISVFPRAGNMRKLTWDHNLESVALRWAAQCPAGLGIPSDSCRRTPEFDVVGQNYGWDGNSVGYPSANLSFQSWIDQMPKFSKPNISLFVDHFLDCDWKHFSQVIWAKTYKLGCGLVQYERAGLYETAIFCNYAPGGNIEGQSIYKIDNPCSACPEGTSCMDTSYPHLCAEIADEDRAANVNGAGTSVPRSYVSMCTWCMLFLLDVEL